MAQFHFDNLAKNLPDAYKKDSKSNNFKILEIERRANNDLRQTLEEIEGMLDIDKATGATLDLYGKRFGQPRGKASDSQYRMMIKSKIVRGLSSGSYKDVVDALCFTFGCNTSDILIVESPEIPMVVTVERAPLEHIIRAGFSTEQAMQLIKSLLPVCITLESAVFNGTFAFGENEGEYNAEQGFGETTDGEIGGYLGWMSSEESTDYLPL